MSYKQIIILRKKYDNGHEISFGKACAMVSHGSMAFLTNMIRKNICPCEWTGVKTTTNDADEYRAMLIFECGLYEQWLNGSFTKCVLEAKNKNQLLKAIKLAEEIGLKEGKDFFLIKDNCNTELEPEEFDENGVGRTLTCIGFKPMDSKIIDKIGKRYQLYK